MGLAARIRPIAAFAVIVAACSPGTPGTTPSPGAPPVPVIPIPATPAAGITPLASGSGPGAIARYDFSVVLDYIGNRAQVNQLVEITNPGPDVWDRVVFHLPYDLQTDRFTLSRVSLVRDVDTAPRNIEVTDDGFLIVILPDPVGPNQTELINIVYGLEAEQTGTILRRPFGDVGYSDRLVQFVNWYLRLVPYQPRRGWARWEATDVGPPLFAEVADYVLRVQAPDDVIVASGGPVSRVGNEWQFAVNNARSIAFSASPEYVELTENAAGVTLLGYHLPEYGDEMQATLAAAAQTLALFAQRYGPYPYSTLVFAQDAYLPSV
ncbi:MAG: hypothetical protein ACE5FI_18325, partial [Anaerolineales bacterium]